MLVNFTAVTRLASIRLDRACPGKLRPLGARSPLLNGAQHAYGVAPFKLSESAYGRTAGLGVSLGSFRVLSIKCFDNQAGQASDADRDHDERERLYRGGEA